MLLNMKSNEALEKLNAGNEMINNRLKEFLKRQRNKIYYYIPSNIFLDRSIRKNYRFLMKSQWWTCKDLKKLQMAKLTNLLNFVYYYVPFYQRIFEKLKINPSDIRTMDDLKVFPIIDKAYVNKHYDEFIPKRSLEKSLPAHTSGSSGEILSFKWSYEYYCIKAAANYRFANWSGKKWLDKDVHFGAPFYGKDKNELIKRKYKDKTWVINTADLSDSKLEEIINLINKVQPDSISGYPSIISFISNYMLNNGIKLISPIKSVLTTSELVFDEMREIIELAFHAKLYDWYGMIEGCASAGQCEYGNYHMNLEYNVIEFVEHNNLKKIVGTNLENFAFPLVRYDTGDIGEFKGYTCSCKRGLPIMKLNGGRINNFLKTKHGEKYIFPAYFAHILKVPIKEAQLVQNRIDSLDLFIVKRNDFKEEHLEKIIKSLEDYLGEITIDVHFVRSIKRSPRGKYQMVVSNI